MTEPATTRSIMRTDDRTFWIVRSKLGAVTYERSGGGYGALNRHLYKPVAFESQHPDGHPCEFLEGDAVCFFDGTGLAPDYPDGETIYRALELEMKYLLRQ